MASYRILVCLGLLVLCSTLTLAEEPNVAVAKKTLDSMLDDIQWVNDNVVLVLTEKGNVYRSGDGGRTWFQQRSTDESRQPMNVKSIHISDANSDYVFLMGQPNSGMNWVTTDAGKSGWKLVKKDLTDVRLHPTQPTWLLGATMSAGCSKGSSPTADCSKVLVQSKDFGQNWQVLKEYIVQFDWSPPFGEPNNGQRFSDNVIFATRHKNQKGRQTFGFWNKDIDFVKTADGFRTEQVLVEHGNRFLFGDYSYLFVAEVNPLKEEEVSLMISRDNTTRMHFERAQLPLDHLTQHSYTILDTSEGSVFLHVNHQRVADNAPSGHVYISDVSGLVYSLSLPNNRRTADGKCDFDKVEGLEGIYLANFIDPTIKDDEESEEENSRRSSKATPQPRKHAKVKAKTVITFDKGGMWSYLRAPQKDSTGKTTTCLTGPNPKECHLHLHGITDVYGPFYSTATAYGLIMATGTVGRYLQEDADDINTYLSRDAGVTWAEVKKGSHIYEFGDHGGLIVMADDIHETSSIEFSWDQGRTWTSLKIVDDPMHIENIIIEPTATAEAFVVYGWRGQDGVLVHLDFSSLHERECKFPNNPGSEDSDYETWMPASNTGDSKCLMGHTTTYTRRKGDRACFNPETFEYVGQTTNCECTDSDFECDYGYVRQEVEDEKGDVTRSGPCVLAEDDERPKHVDPYVSMYSCDATGPNIIAKQYLTRGYRRVAGDTCVTKGNKQWDPILMECPSFFNGGHITWIVIVLLLIVVIGFGIVTLMNKTAFCETCWKKGTTAAYRLLNNKTEAPETMDDDGVDPLYLNEDEFARSAELLREDGGASSSSTDKKRKESSSELTTATAASTSTAARSSTAAAARRGDVQIPILPPPGKQDDFDPRREAKRT